MTEIAPSGNPYVGPRTFSYEQRHLFFGREREARDLLARVLSERLLLFYAQSGAGKSSLLNTRVIPQLQEEKGFVVLPVGRVSGELPAGVAAVDNIYVFNLLLSIDDGEDAARLAHVTLSDFLARLARRTVSDGAGGERKGWVYDAALTPAAAGPNARRYILIIDQFEEIITAHPGRWQEREDFFRQLNRAMADDPMLWVLLALREDYIAPIEPYAPLMAERMRGRFYMERMGIEAALDAVRRPAELGGRPFADGVAERLVEDLRQVRVPGQEATIASKYVEPVQLQVVCYQLWENIKQRPPGLISATDLREAGDVDRALTQFYEEILAPFRTDPWAPVTERQLRSWFDRELITDAGTRGLVRQGEEATGSLPNAVVSQLQRRFLVRAEARGGDVWIELVHDRFVKPIRESNRAWFAHYLNPLTQAAEAWDKAGRDPTRLYIGSQLKAAAAELQAHAPDFGELEQAFVEAGQQAEARRAGQRQGIIASGSAFLALVFIALAGWALWSRGQAASAARAAATAQVVAEAEAARAKVAHAGAQTSEADARSQAKTAVAAEGAAEAASTRAFEERAAANAAGTRASEERDAANAASTQAVAGEATAQAANTAQAMARNDLVAILQANLTAQAATQRPSPTATATPSATPVGMPTVGSIPGPTPPPLAPTPTGTRAPTRTSTPVPSPTFDLLVIAQQTQLAQVRATQTASASEVIGQSVKGRPIEVVSIGRGRRHVVVVGGLHGGFAPGTVQLARQVAGHFGETPGDVPSDMTLHVVLNASPDSPNAPGKKAGRLNAHGVDLNRNWDCNWKANAVWASQSVSGGTAPFSEPETQALRDYLLKLKPEAVVFWEARGQPPITTAGGCGPQSRVSEPLARAYAAAAGYRSEPFTAYALTGDVTQWLDAQGIPAISVLLPDYVESDYARNLKAVQALLATP